jgi:hypothetical protein
MTIRHGTRYRYTQGCRCDDCKNANTLYLRRRRERQLTGEVTQSESREANASPGPVESGVTAEIDGLAAQARPWLAQAALALARILDNPKAISQQPAAAKTLATLLDKLRSASVRGRRGNLALVRTMTAKDGP